MADTPNSRQEKFILKSKDGVRLTETPLSKEELEKKQQLHESQGEEVQVRQILEE